MRRRGLGLGAHQMRQKQDELCRKRGEEIANEQLAKLTEHMEQFKANLEQFAAKHKREIRRDAEFRRRFQEMCAHIGVDPLQSSSSFWTKMLGMGDFYYELGIQLIEICMATQKQNGGLIRLGELTDRVNQARRRSRHRAAVHSAASSSDAAGSKDEVSADDVLRALSKLHVLGGGIRVFKAKGGLRGYIVQSVSRELSKDDDQVLELAQENGGWFDANLLVTSLKWNSDRVHKFIQQMIMEGLVWVDEHAGQTKYWFPGLI